MFQEDTDGVVHPHQRPTRPLIHTLGCFTVTASVALLVYQKFGLAMLRRSWFNLELIWAVALIVTGFVALLV